MEMKYSTQTPKKSTLFSGQYLCNCSTLDIGVLGYIGIVWPKEHSPEDWSIPPVTPCIQRLNHSLFTTSHGMCRFGHLTCINSIPFPVHASSCHVQVWSLLANSCFLISILQPDLHFPYPFCAFTLPPSFLYSLPPLSSTSTINTSTPYTSFLPSSISVTAWHFR